MNRSSLQEEEDNSIIPNTISKEEDALAETMYRKREYNNHDNEYDNNDEEEGYVVLTFV